MGGSAKPFITRCERLIYENAACGRCVNEKRQQWPMEVIRNDYAIKALPAIRPRAALQVRDTRVNIFDARQRIDRWRINVDRFDTPAPRGEVTGVAPAAAGHIENNASAANQWRETANPGGRAKRWGI